MHIAKDHVRTHNQHRTVTRATSSFDRRSIHSKGRRSPSLALLAALGAIAALGTVPAFTSTAGAAPLEATGADGPSPARDEIRYARNLSHAFRQVAKELAPSVVAVTTVDRPPYEGQRPIMLPPGVTQPDRYGKGSGVILTSDGFIVTNCHVVRGADAITIKLTDQRELTATIIGLDPDTDLAVLKVEATDLVPARFGDSEGIEPGEWVLALGNPFGLEQTLTAGIISAKGRSGMGLATYENFLQTDAAINPGNSGGPLVDLDGRVIGINTAISSTDGGNHGIGFAIPSAMAQGIVNELIERGHILRGWLGVGVEPVLQGDRVLPGAILSYVAPDTPASRAGLRTGDIVLKLDDHAVGTPSDFIRVIGERAPQSEVIVTALRRGRSIQATAVLGERPTPAHRVLAIAPSQPPAPEPPASAPDTGAPPTAEPSPGAPSEDARAPRDGSRRRERAQPVD